MRTTIEEGDKVSITFIGSEILFECEVLHVPCVVGDSWHLINKSGKLFYVQLFETMQLIT